MAFERLAYLEAVVGADITQFRKGMRDIRNEVGILSESMGGLAGLGRTLTYTVTAPAIAFGTMAVQQASEFDAAMRNINSIVGLSEEQLGSLTAQVMDFGKTTRGGVTDSANALYTVFSAGILDTATAFNIMTVATKTAEAGLADLEGTTQSIVGTQLAYNDLSAEFTQRTSDALTRMVQVGVGSMDEFTHAMATVTPMAAMMGMSVEELTGDLAFLTQRNQSAANAATNLNNALTSLAKPTEAMKSAFQELGVHGAEELIEKFGGVNGAFQALIGTTNGTQQEIQALFNNIRGAKAINVFAQDIAGWNATMEEFNSSLDGATMRAWDEQSKSFAHHWDLLQSALGAAAITVGNALIPALIPLIDGITSLVIGFTELDPSVIQFGIAAVGAVAAAAPLLWLVSGLIAAISPLGIVMGLVGAAVASNWETIAGAFKAGIDTIQSEIQPFMEMLESFWGEIIPTEAVEIATPEVALVGEPTVIDPMSIITVDTTKSLWQIFTEQGYDEYFSWQEFMRLAEEGGWTGGAVEVGAEITIDMSTVRTMPPPMPLLTVDGTAVETDTAAIETQVNNDMGSAIDNIVNTITPMWDALNFDYAASGMGDLFDGIMNFADDIATADWSGLITIGTALLIMTNGFVGAAASMLGDLLTGIGDAIKGVADAISLAMDGDITGALNRLGEGFAGLFLALGGMGATLITTITDALNALFHLDIPSFTEWFDQVQQQFASDVENYHPDPVSFQMPLVAEAVFSDLLINSEFSDLFQGNVSTYLGDTAIRGLQDGSYVVEVTVPVDIDWRPEAVSTVLDVAALTRDMNLEPAERAAAQALIDAWAGSMNPDDRRAFMDVLSAYYAGGGIVITPEGFEIQINPDGSMIVLGDGTTPEVTIPQFNLTATAAMVTANGWAVVPPVAPITVTDPPTEAVAVDVPVTIDPISTADIATTFSDGLSQGMDAQTIINTYLAPIETKWNEMFASEGAMTTNLTGFVANLTTNASLIDTQAQAVATSFDLAATGGINALERLYAKAHEVTLAMKDEFGGTVLAIQGVMRGIASLIQMEGVVDIEINIGTSGNMIDGSHAKGLSNVPYDGYMAELHAGEQVLTKEEAQDYRYDQMNAGVILGAGAGGSSTVNNNQINLGTNLTVDDVLFELDRRGYRIERK